MELLAIIVFWFIVYWLIKGNKNEDTPEDQLPQESCEDIPSSDYEETLINVQQKIELAKDKNLIGILFNLYNELKYKEEDGTASVHGYQIEANKKYTDKSMRIHEVSISINGYKLALKFCEDSASALSIEEYLYSSLKLFLENDLVFEFGLQMFIHSEYPEWDTMDYNSIKAYVSGEWEEDISLLVQKIKLENDRHLEESKKLRKASEAEELKKKFGL
jgi:hypothetical protein